MILLWRSEFFRLIRSAPSLKKSPGDLHRRPESVNMNVFQDINGIERDNDAWFDIFEGLYKMI